MEIENNKNMLNLQQSINKLKKKNKTKGEKKLNIMVKEQQLTRTGKTTSKRQQKTESVNRKKRKLVKQG